MKVLSFKSNCTEFAMKSCVTFLIVTSVTGREIQPDQNGDYKIKVSLDKSEFSFLWLGDWGGWPAPVFNTPIQIAVANSMMRTAKVWNPEFIYSLGDNFYFWGISDIYDPMWTKTYENVYTRRRFLGRTHFLYLKIENMFIFRSGNLYSLVSQ